MTDDPPVQFRYPGPEVQRVATLDTSNRDSDGCGDTLDSPENGGTARTNMPATGTFTAGPSRLTPISQRMAWECDIFPAGR
ncbi:hypothetical protein KPP03845_200154 (plasmid) [Streptomyces xanthophaeus]|nr:hypothetical protein KPP03845_200154 [Streptomyces xanthophaeus]